MKIKLSRKYKTSSESDYRRYADFLGNTLDKIIEVENDLSQLQNMWNSPDELLQEYSLGTSGEDLKSAVEQASKLKRIVSRVLRNVRF